MSEQIHIIRKEKQNSYEHGKAGNRVKIYYDDIKTLETQLKEISIMEKKIKDFEEQLIIDEISQNE